MRWKYVEYLWVILAALPHSLAHTLTRVTPQICHPIMCYAPKGQSDLEAPIE